MLLIFDKKFVNTHTHHSRTTETEPVVKKRADRVETGKECVVLLFVCFFFGGRQVLRAVLNYEEEGGGVFCMPNLQIIHVNTLGA